MKRFNNKILFIVLIALAAAFVLTRVFRTPAREGNLEAEELRVDTAKVDKLQLLPLPDSRHEVILVRENKRWKVSQGNLSTDANEDLVKNLLDELASLKAERIVTRKKEKWNNYEVGDSTGIDVIVSAGGKEIQKFKVGKENAGITYVRLPGEDAVYAITGSLATTVNQKFGDWRSHAFLRINTDNMERITFTYPADSGFVLNKNDKTWMIDHAEADSASVQTYLDKIHHKDLSAFADDSDALAAPDITVTVEGNTRQVIKGWKSSSGHWVLLGDAQRGVYFLDDRDEVAQDIFPAKKSLLKEP